jgi:4-diphosphocytidyl-2-C-methyl-D-erythritol kinase
MKELICPAPAKLNLFLHVVGRRADGYHLLQTVFRLLDYGDTLRLTLRADGQVRRTLDLPGVPATDDLCVRAAQLLQRETGCQLGVDIQLDKRLPMGGGLGGGSSDAASVLLGLNRLWNLRLTRQELQCLGLRLGADVPVFVFGQSAFAEGIGEALQAVALPPAWYVVLVPPVSVSTQAIFSHPGLTRDSKIIKIADFSEAGKNPAGTRNDLQALVCGEYPAVAKHIAWLNRYGEARMTGSGACVFAGFDTEQAAHAVMEKLPDGMRGFMARGLDRHPLYDLVN